MRSDITYGDGMYKSVDAGQTWTHIGLEDTRQIGRILVDPANPDTVFVAALGHAYGPNAQRGVFRSIDGGKAWSRVLHTNDDTGAIDLAFDPQDSRVIFAAMWQTRRPPWNIYPASNGPGSGLYKSSDGGATWQHLQGNGVPSDGLGRMGIAVAPSDRNRVYLIVDAKDGGLYRSDDAGNTFHRADNEKRIWGRGWYFGGIAVDPKNPDIVYVANTTTYKSVDGGKSFTAFKGAPGGDDYHSIWISPEDSSRMIISSDQGSIVTLNGAKTWSSWYNQPTGQFYHVITDSRFPYWLYGAQQDSGAMAVPSRSDYASLSGRDWRAIRVGDENGYIAPDPSDPNTVFGGSVTRFNWSDFQDKDISPVFGRDDDFRHTWTLPLTFSPANPRKLYFSHQMLFRTINGGKSWDQISPDLTRENPPVPSNLDLITARYGLDSPRKGVIYAIAPSPLDANLIWVGTDDGLIHVSKDDGQHWEHVTPQQLTAWSKVGTIEASHFDPQVAYAAVDRHRLEDLKPYIYRTQDGGKTWQLIASGIPDGSYVNVVREDPRRRGLLFAGTELGMYVSFDDGGKWLRFQLNLPVSSVRDIAIHGDDLVVATHGRALWILDDITPLRQIENRIGSEPASLFRPSAALRIRPGSDQGTPDPAEVPKAENPASGAVLDYYLKTAATTPVVMQILDSKGQLVRRYSSDDKVTPVEEKTLVVTMNWMHPQKPLPASAGMHRFVWDMHYGSPLPKPTSPYRSFGKTGPWAPPGHYTVRLTVDGKSYERSLELKSDPRVTASTEDLQREFSAASRCLAALVETAQAANEASQIDEKLAALELKNKDNLSLSKSLSTFHARVRKVLGPPPVDYGAAIIPLTSDRESLRYLAHELTELGSAIESADAAPTAEQDKALAQDTARFSKTMSDWHQLLQQGLPALNGNLKQAGIAELTLAPQSQ